MTEKHTTKRAVIEIIAAVILIIFLYFFIQYLDHNNALIASADTEEGTERTIPVNETVTIVLGDREYQFEHEVKTYLLLGTDESGNEDGVGDEYQGSMADVLMLLVVDEQESCYGILQLNRDTITEVTLLQHDGSGYASAEIQLCTAHWYGGDKQASCENTVEAVSNMLGGLPIDGYYALQMEAMTLLNQAVGGVTVTLEDDMTDLDPEMEKGATLTLTDEQAEILLHARYDMEDDRNTERMRRQRLFLNGFFEKLKTIGSDDGDFAIRLYDTLHPYATENINMNEMTTFVKNMDSYTNRGIFYIDGESTIGQRLGDGEDHWEFYMDEGSLDSCMNALYPLTYIGEK